MTEVPEEVLNIWKERPGTSGKAALMSRRAVTLIGSYPGDLALWALAKSGLPARVWARALRPAADLSPRFGSHVALGFAPPHKRRAVVRAISAREDAFEAL